ncbi:hypothetical protein GPECTOR_746g911 [Gonium pectorale]|uniref:Uncharacterized protein n=1 Tax=Gonium pectorale TaxID=33097 RepID=A0A150FVS1_GONPE|nr:hypothetical protein GPECTOR_746g911 [Gonium pectorale]|eukprot:KXZ41130.1 hypothetical protein GPECTOR_746g911 [Gonium pectorale]
MSDENSELAAAAAGALPPAAGPTAGGGLQPSPSRSRTVNGLAAPSTSSSGVPPAAPLVPLPRQAFGASADGADPLGRVPTNRLLVGNIVLLGPGGG